MIIVKIIIFTTNLPSSDVTAFIASMYVPSVCNWLSPYNLLKVMATSQSSVLEGVLRINQKIIFLISQ